jgi:hypothetical protein
MDQVMTAASELSVLVPEIWSGKFYNTLLASTPFNDVVGRDYEGDIQALGDTVNITSFPQFDVAEDLAENGVSEADSITATQSQLVINHMLVKDFIVTYRAEVQSIDASMQLMDLAMYAIMKKMQAILIADTVASASSPDHQIAYASPSTLAVADILGGKELLDTQNVEEVGRKMIVGPAQLNDLLAVSTFTSRDYVDGKAVQTGGVSSPVFGFDLRWTSEAGNTAYLFHPLYMQAAVQRAPKVGVYDVGVNGKRATRFNFTALFGNVQVSNVRVVEIG